MISTGGKVPAGTLLFPVAIPTLTADTIAISSSVMSSEIGSSCGRREKAKFRYLSHGKARTECRKARLPSFQKLAVPHGGRFAG